MAAPTITCPSCRTARAFWFSAGAGLELYQCEVCKVVAEIWVCCGARVLPPPDWGYRERDICGACGATRRPPPAPPPPPKYSPGIVIENSFGRYVMSDWNEAKKEKENGNS